MPLFPRYLLLFFSAIAFLCCKQADKKKEAIVKQATICIQPFSNIDKSLVNYVLIMTKSVYPRVVLNNNINLPENAFYEPRNRYKADSILKYFNSLSKANTIYVGLTNEDISTRKGDVADFGVMGLGLCPGNACVISTFRLDKKNLKEQLFKVTIHEIGHTQGLNHCKEKFCFMRDAEGKNPTNDEKEFCKKCKLHLVGKGFII